MSDLLLYLIKANVALALFCLGYYLLLRKLTFYGINRYYLVFALGFSALYPAIPIDQWFAANQDAPSQLLLTLSDWQQLQLPEETNNFSSVFSSAYWISIGFFGLLFLIKLMGIGRIHLRSVPAQWDRFAYRKINEIISPFSFWTNIYFNPLLHSEDEYEKIFSHEQVHVRQLHSLDVLLVEIALIFFWYNPFCWLIRKAIQENIEFITDQRVLSLGIDKKSYQYSLVQISTSSHPSYLGSHFNFKNLKKRIIMMNKKQSSKMQLGKYVFIIPAVIAGSFFFAACTMYDDLQIKTPSPTASQDIDGARPLHIIDGVKETPESRRSYDPQEIESINVLKGEAAIAAYGEEGKNGVMEITTKQDGSFVPPQFENTRIIINEKPAAYVEFSKLKPSDIESISVLKGEYIIERYGEEGKGGVIEITTKSKN